MSQSATVTCTTSSSGSPTADTVDLETRSNAINRTLTEFVHSEYVTGASNDASTSCGMMSRGRPVPEWIIDPEGDLHLATAILADLKSSCCCSDVTEDTASSRKMRLQKIRDAVKAADEGGVGGGMTEEQMVEETSRLIDMIPGALMERTERMARDSCCEAVTVTALGLGLTAALAFSLAAGLKYWQWSQHAGSSVGTI